MTRIGPRRSVDAMAASHSDTPAIEARGIAKVFGQGGAEVRALDGVDLVVPQGEMVAIMGPSGLRQEHAAPHHRRARGPTAGTVRSPAAATTALDDKTLTALRRGHIGFVFQFFNLLGSLTAVENVAAPGADRRAARTARSGARGELLGASGSAIGRAHARRAVGRPAAAGVDRPRAAARARSSCSPTSRPGNLDTKSGREVLRLLRELSGAEGRTVVMVTHDPSAAAVADRVVFLRDGRVAGEVPGGSAQRVGEFFASLEPAADISEPAAA